MLEAVIGFLGALVLGTLVEYWAHRFMHNWLLKKKHALHHRDGFGQGWFGEFIDYLLPTLPFFPLGFLYSLEAGIGWASGCFCYACFAAYAHQLQHDRPELCFWLKRPVHHLHHQHHMWHYNFGISFDIWDRVFGTYKCVDWTPPEPGKRYPLKSYFQIKWF